ncbi:MAG: beta-galactosidase [Planctomycetota bacterium]
MHAKDLLGSQIWLEEDDTPERVEALFAQAAEVGLGWARLIFVWPWLQPAPETPPDDWNWALWDAAFDAAQRHGIKVKVTLTANSGPWHWGTPSMLHSHTGLMDEAMWPPSRAYVEACVRRYAKHPALGQWILWNEPFDEGWESPAFLAYWRRWLAERYGGDLGPLNAKWRTGYASFDDIPRAADVPHPAHALVSWNSSFPFLDEMSCRQAWLVHQLEAVRGWVRAADPDTPTCVNPTHIHANRPHGGTDLQAMSGVVETLGASFHPSWHFTFARRADFPALIYAGVAALRHIPGDHAVETTEVQTGNTTDSGLVPNDAGPDAVVKYHLAALAAGSTSVTGWCFNARQHDNEAGDWALLDDLDQIGPRAAALRRLHDRLEAIVNQLGPLQPARPRVWVATDDTTQAYESAHGRQPLVNTPGRHVEDSARGAALIVVECLRLGVPAATVPLAALADRLEPGDVAVLSHVTAYNPEHAAPILAKVERGAHLVLDATTGRRDHHLSMPRPWPAGFAEPIGLHTRGLESRDDHWALAGGGHALMCRTQPTPPGSTPGSPPSSSPSGPGPASDPSPSGGGGEDTSGDTSGGASGGGGDWRAWAAPRFADGEPLALTRSYGAGRLVHLRAPLGPSLLHTDPAPWRPVLDQLTAHLPRPVRVLGRDDVFALPLTAGGHPLTVLLADRPGPLRVHAPTPLRHDHWSPQPLAPPAWGEQHIDLAHGYAVVG